MPAASMSAASTYSTVHATATRLTSRAMRSRTSALSCLESLRPSTAGSRGSTTAPTASGPASGPRPTSSSPTTTPAPRPSASARSNAYSEASRSRSACSASIRRRATSTASRTPLRVSATSERSSTANSRAPASCNRCLISATVGPMRPHVPSRPRARPRGRARSRLSPMIAKAAQPDGRRNATSAVTAYQFARSAKINRPGWRSKTARSPLAPIIGPFRGRAYFGTRRQAKKGRGSVRRGFAASARSAAVRPTEPSGRTSP